MKSRILGMVLLGVALLAGQAQAAPIGFDNLGNLVTVTNQYANVIFSAGGGDVVLTTSQNPPYLGSQPNLICTGSVAGAIDCIQDLILTFTTPVDNLTFTAFGNQTAVLGTFALADVFLVGGSTVTNIPLNVSHIAKCGSPILDCAGDPQSLLFTGIARVLIHDNTDAAGTGYDDFSFTPEAAPVPEPSTLSLTGLCGIAWAGSRFRARKRV